MKMVLSIKTTSLCNAMCKNCSVVPYSKASGYKWDIILLSGGEPLLWKFLPEAVQKLRDSKIIKEGGLRLFTNGIAIKESNIAMLGEVVEKLDLFRISDIGTSSKAGIELLKKHCRNRKNISVVNRETFLVPPQKQVPDSLPAICGCDAFSLVHSAVDICGPSRTIACSKNWNMEDFPYLSTPLQKDFFKSFDGINKYKQVFCQYCIANRKVAESLEKEKNIIQEAGGMVAKTEMEITEPLEMNIPDKGGSFFIMKLLTNIKKICRHCATNRKLVKNFGKGDNSTQKRIDMASKIEIERTEHLEANIPDSWDYKKVLYIGANEKRFHYNERLKKNECITDVLEIDKERCEGIEKKFNWLNKVICGNVINVDQLLPDVKYDMVLWSHGPEILEKKYFEVTISKLEKITNNLLVIMCPWGRYVYGKPSSELNAIDTNITALYEEDFRVLGFMTSVLGERDVNNSNLLAWKYILKK